MLYKVEQIPLEKLRPSPFNPRKDFPNAELKELAASIEELGIIEPLIVRAASTPPDGHYEIIAGERRFRAAKLAGLVNVPCMQQDYADVRSRELQIAENLMRQGITPLEEASGFEELLDAAKGLFNVERLAERIGKSKEYVYARLKLLKLAEPAKKALEAGKISASHAVELVPLKPEQQAEMVREITHEYSTITSVGALRDAIKENYEPRKAPVVSKAEAARRKKWKDDEAKRRVRQASENKKQDAQRVIDSLVEARALGQLWPKLRIAKKLPFGFVLEQLFDNLYDSDENVLVRILGGKPPQRLDTMVQKLPEAQLPALSVFLCIANGLGYGKENQAVFKNFGIRLEKLRADVVAEAKAAATKAAAPKPPVQASAKPARRAKPKKAKARR
jgi:ParB family transcriptional regulator, chromosome partitioning protein